MTIFVYCLKIMLSGGGLHCKCLQGFTVFPEISMEKGCKNQQETLFSSKGKIAYFEYLQIAGKSYSYQVQSGRITVCPDLVQTNSEFLYSEKIGIWLVCSIRYLPTYFN